MKLRLLTTSIIIATVFLVVASPVRAWWLVDQFGGLTEFGPEGQVLGEGSGKNDEGKREEFKTEFKPDERKTEMRFGDENRIKTEFKPGESKTEFRQGETRIKLERKDGEVRMKIKNEATGEERELEIKNGAEEKMRLRERTEFEKPEMELPEIEDEIEIEAEQELLRIREREDRNEIRVGSDSGRFVIKRNRVGAISEFPLSIDLSTNTLSVTTPAGEKQVTILPDQAVQNMLSRNVIDKVIGEDSGDLSTRIKVSQSDDGNLIYEVDGEKQKRLFGLIPLKFKKTAVVSVETGELMTTRETITARLLDLISF